MSGTRRRRLLLKIGVQLAAVGVVAFVFYRERDLFLGFKEALSRVVWFWLVAAFVAEMASILPLAEAQRAILRVGGVEVPRTRMALITLASNAISMSVPTGVALAEGYSYKQYRHFGGEPEDVAWAELSAGALAFSALAALALVGAIIGPSDARLTLVVILSVVLIGALAAAMTFRRPRLLVASIEWIQSHVGRHLGAAIGRGLSHVRDVSRGLLHLHPPFPIWVSALGFSGLNWVLDALCLAFAFLAVGGPVPWGAVLLAFAGTKVVSSLGITPGGIGIVEGGLVAVFVASGSKGSTAAAAVLLYRGLTLIGLVLLGWVAAGALAARNRRSGAVGSP